MARQLLERGVRQCVEQAYAAQNIGNIQVVRDDGRPTPIKLIDRFSINVSDAGLNNFRFEYNTSQSRVGPEICTGFRNLVILQNVTDVDAIVAVDLTDVSVNLTRHPYRK